MITYQLKIHLEEPRMLSSNMEFVAGDVGAYRLAVSFFDNGTKVDLLDKTVTVKAKRADGVVLSQAGEIKDNTAHITLLNGMYEVPGEVVLEIALCDSKKNYVTTKRMIATVLEGLGEPCDATENVSVYVTLLGQAAAQLDAATALLAKSETQLSAAEEQLDATKVLLREEMDSLQAEVLKKADKEEISAALNTKADKQEISAALNTKADKQETNAALNTKADKQETNAALNTKADKQETNAALSLKTDKKESANALKGFCSGEVLHIDDISPLCHTMHATVESKNKVKTQMVDTAASGAEEDVYLTEPFTVSFQLSDDFSVSTSVWRMRVLYQSGKTDFIRDDSFVGKTSRYEKTFSATEDDPVVKIWVRNSNITAGALFDFQVETGTSATPYTPFVEVADVTLNVHGKNIVPYAVGEDGMIEIESVAPTMTLVPDKDGAIVKVEYNRDTNKVIEELTNAILSLGGNV